MTGGRRNRRVDTRIKVEANFNLNRTGRLYGHLQKYYSTALSGFNYGSAVRFTYRLRTYGVPLLIRPPAHHVAVTTWRIF
jgi:hypothetical protein